MEGRAADSPEPTHSRQSMQNWESQQESGFSVFCRCPHPRCIMAAMAALCTERRNGALLAAVEGMSSSRRLHLGLNKMMRALVAKTLCCLCWRALCTKAP